LHIARTGNFVMYEESQGRVEPLFRLAEAIGMTFFVHHKITCACDVQGINRIYRFIVTESRWILIQCMPPHPERKQNDRHK
ncbi:MAG: hypothetical protein AAFR67_17680, partial [Chloroflexota bacterium]